MADGNGPGRAPPSNMDAEAAVLSACLLDPTKAALDTARGVLGNGEDFYADANRRVWDAILDLDGAGMPPDVVTVAQRLRETNRLAQIGGAPYLAQLADATPAIANVEAHARIIADLGKQRRLVATYQRLALEGYGRIEDVPKWALDGAQAVADAAGQGSTGEPAETFAELVPAALERTKHRAQHGKVIAGLDTGWTAYTKKLGGLKRAKHHVVGGRPGMGKTGFVMGLALNVARQGYGVVFASAEMEKDELVDRALAVEANVNGRSIEAGTLNRDEWAATKLAAERLRKLPISIVPCPGWTVGQVRAAVRAESKKLAARGFGDTALVIVDYLQLFDGERERGETREAEVSRIAKRLTWMAQEFNVALVSVSQLNRSLESRNNRNKRPTLADLRESGAIEQEAYSVTLLYRDDYYQKDSKWAGTVECIVAKQRNGEKGMVRLAFRAESTKFSNLEGEQADMAYSEDEYE